MHMKLLQVPRHSFLLLLISLLLMLVVSPYLKEYPFLNVDNILLNPFLSTIFVTSLYLVTDNRRFFIIGILILIPVLVINTRFYFDKTSINPLISSFVYIVFFSYTSLFLCRFLIKSKTVSINVLYAAVCLYLFIAIIWSFIYVATYHSLDGAFSFSENLIKHADIDHNSTSLFSYFSFVTMTTLGYGDITPIHPIARAWVAVQSILGQLYLAIVMARLVGLYIVDAKK
jgi:ion channel